jgi:formylglycine-generating enzyme required for sulfatase activity
MTFKYKICEMRSAIARALLFAAFIVPFMGGCGSANSPKHTAQARSRAIEQAKQLGFELQKKIVLREGVTLDLCFIPGGEFELGSPTGEIGRDANDLPCQKRVLESFYMSTCPVTQMQYSSVMGDNPSTFLDKEYAVHMVTYEQADEFCKKVAKITGQVVRLPNENEFEYACRADEGTPYSSGADATDLAEEGWFAGNSESRPHPVGKKRPNAWGVFDTHGNVWQWCSDTPEIILGSNASTPTHALRGGSWMDAPQFCRAASRVVAPAAFKNINVGFRIVLIPTKPAPSR